uniref:cysteine peptidase family C39 domain-containing protein n=1 Tax=aff. Roholtiella sp. LEGE 12411 TaxID=1828822 RepID=UPI0030D7ABB7
MLVKFFFQTFPYGKLLRNDTCQYGGKRLSLNTLRNLARRDCMGASVQNLAEAAQTLGYEVLSVRASLSKLDSYYNPWIAHWQAIHYVIVWRVKTIAY